MTPEELKTLRRLREKMGKERDAACCEQNQRFVGRYMRYSNTYGDGKRWWLWGHVRSMSRDGYLRGVEFQGSCRDRLEVKPLYTLALDGWQFVTPAQYRRAMREFKTRVEKVLTCP